MLTVLIVEDEELAARKLEMLLRKIDPSIRVAASLNSVARTVEWLTTNQADLIFLDIQLSDRLSFEIFEQITVSTPVIFITAYDEYALKAFRVNSIDYLLKPLDEENLRASLVKFRTFPASVNTQLQALLSYFNPPRVYQERIAISFGGKIRNHFIRDTAYLFAQDKSVFLLTFQGVKYPSDYTLDKWETILDPKVFFRINRRIIVNIHAIKEIISYSTRQLRLQLNPAAEQDIIVPADKITGFKLWLNQ